ncbi:MAG: helix-turn-helix domain-containing protein [Planctomycetes bacterium]|nr:helix-turn-helix domain-containing protein [Planctomycetota bacterium]
MPHAEALLVRAPEAARRLSISPRKLWELTNRREIPHLRIGRSVLYRVAALEAWALGQEQKGRGPRVAGAARASARPAGADSTEGEA